MGQLLLGFRSLLLKIAIFVIMAALLAWALGGTLWPRPVVVEYESVQFNGAEWYWSLSVGGERIRADRPAAPPRWTMMTRAANASEHAGFPNESQPAVFHQIAGPIIVNDSIVFAGKMADIPGWATWHSPQTGQWVVFIARDNHVYQAYPVPDRLAVEQQLARLEAGLDVQDAGRIRDQRQRVIDPPDPVDG